MLQGLADAGGSGSDGNSRKEQKSSHNGLPSHPHNQPKRSRTGTPTPAPKMPRIEPSRLAPVPITRVVTPPSISHEPETEDQQPIVEVDPGDNPNVKQEGWMMASHGDDSNEYEIPPDQFEQDMQAEDEQYIQAGNDALTGQQVETVYDLLHLLLIRKWEFVAAAHTFAIYEILITCYFAKFDKFYLPSSQCAKIDGRDFLLCNP